ncbi:MAG: hypothetical protein H0U59_08395 [Gemmatimonadaceae bacterium]|nr:hypothetical protein [Gemmatimonadaceae bacterium]MBA3761805.1 hypothetical protein [Chthoniobacterales bacterium]
MPLVIDATVGGAASNSYATQAAADSHALASVGPSAAAWGLKSADQKAQALISATLEIDALPFIGERATTIQALEWPRVNARTLTGRLYLSTVLPASLVAATIELAISYAVNSTIDVLTVTGNNKKSVTAGDVSVTWFDPGEDTSEYDLSWLPGIVQRLLRPLIRVLVTNEWGAGTSVRTS